MGQTHRDDDSPPADQMRELFSDNEDEMARLEKRASEMMGAHASAITAGKPDEEPGVTVEVDAKSLVKGVHITKRPDDEQGILRISIGGVIGDFCYCTYRGDRKACRAMLKAAIRALDQVQD